VARVYLEHITRQFGSAIAIEDITFEVPDGEFWVLVGPSGCGKSTLLRTIAGLERATSGKLYIGDRLVNQVPARQRDVAMVFQNYALYPHMTVAQNLGFGLRMRRADRAEIQTRIQTVAQALAIDHLLDRKPSQLSGGQQQRVALGRAIARQPQVFLLDEPLSNLDAQLRDDTRAELKQLHQSVGVTTIYVTHDQVEAMTLADQIVVLNRGKIQQIGAPQQIYAQPANEMVATFLGSPPMNILSGLYQDKMFYKTILIGGHPIPCPERFLEGLAAYMNRPIHVGLRPEHIQIASQPEASHLTVEVLLVEPLGRETLVRTQLANGRSNGTTICNPNSVAIYPSNSVESEVATLNLQIPPDQQVSVGDRLPILLDLNYALIFDPQTGDRIL
jgi:multiple sugar transport system ATP-binding protein